MMHPIAPSGDDWVVLVAGALAGDDAAWRCLVDRLSGVAWKVVNSYRLSEADRDDAFASTFFRLYEKLGSIREPSRLPGWIATTARNEANSLWRRSRRSLPTADLPLRDFEADTVADRVVEDDILAEVMRALGRLPAEGQALLRLLTAVPPLSYDEIATILGMPKGSIGPTLGRLLTKLRKALGIDEKGQES